VERSTEDSTGKEYDTHVSQFPFCPISGQALWNSPLKVGDMAGWLLPIPSGPILFQRGSIFSCSSHVLSKSGISSTNPSHKHTQLFILTVYPVQTNADFKWRKIHDIQGLKSHNFQYGPLYSCYPLIDNEVMQIVHTFIQIMQCIQGLFPALWCTLSSYWQTLF